MVSFKVGEPPSVFTKTLSLNEAIAFNVSPAFSVLFCTPVALLKATLLTLGASVSMLMLGVVPAVPKLPATSM